jgi:hypothetical protein
MLESWTVPFGERAPASARLAPGEYAFRARARDVSCAWFAEDCDVLALPDDAVLLQRLHELGAPEPICAASACDEGECSGEGDAGVTDGGGGDAGREDGGRDAGMRDAGRDTGPTGPCDGRTDGTACAEAGVSGTCRGGACCTGCWNGTACRGGADNGECGRGGGMCAACPECTSCVMSACAPMPDRTVCFGGDGRCIAGACCDGCLAGPTCQGGTAYDVCGWFGIDCVDCTGTMGCDPSDANTTPFWPCF